MPTYPSPFPLRAVINNGVTSVLHGGGTGGGSILFSAGTLSSALSAITFNNGGGVSFGLNGAGVITASVAPGAGAGTGFTTATTPGSNVVGTLGAGGLSMGIPAYLTTAMASDASSVFAGTGFTTATTAGTAIVGTLDTNGLSMGVPKYLTTAAAGTGISAINISAGSTSSNVSAVTFSNGSGVTFGFDGSNVTASVQTNYQTPGAYLTTAALSQDSSKYAGTGLTTASTTGSLLVGTQATNGLSLGVPAWLTTSPSGTISNIKISAGTLSANRSDVTFSNSGGVSFGLDTNGVITATVATNYAGQGFTTATTAGTNIVGTLSTNGLSMGVPAYLTTATAGAFTPRLDQVLDPNQDKVFSMASNMLQLQFAHGGSWSTNATREGMFELDVQGNLTQEADVVHAHQHGGAPTRLDILHVEGDGANVTGLRLQMSASVAAEINHPIKFTTEDAGYAIGSVPMILGTQMSNSVANLNANYLQGRVSSQMAGLGFTSASTAGTAVVATLSTNGLSMVIPAYLTAAAGGGGIAASNSQTLFSTGTVAFSEGGGAITIASSAAGQRFLFSVPQTSSIVGSGVVSVGSVGSTISISAPNTSSIVGAGGISILSAGNTLSISGIGAGTATSTFTITGNNITLSADATGISIGYPNFVTSAGSAVMSYWANMPWFAGAAGITAGGSAIQVVPLIVPQAISGGFMRFPCSVSLSAGNVTGTSVNTVVTIRKTHTVALNLLTKLTGASSLSLGYYTSTYGSFVYQTQFSAAGTGSHFTVSVNATLPQTGGYNNAFATSVATTAASWSVPAAINASLSSQKWIDLPFAMSLSAGNYWLGIGMSTSSDANGATAYGASGMALTTYAQAELNSTFGVIGSGTTSNVQNFVGLGSWSTNSLVMSTASIDLNSISLMASQPMPYVQIIRNA